MFLNYSLNKKFASQFPKSFPASPSGSFQERGPPPRHNKRIQFHKKRVSQNYHPLPMIGALVVFRAWSSKSQRSSKERSRPRSSARSWGKPTGGVHPLGAGSMLICTRLFMDSRLARGLRIKSLHAITIVKTGSDFGVPCPPAHLRCYHFVANVLCHVSQLGLQVGTVGQSHLHIICDHESLTAAT